MNTVLSDLHGHPAIPFRLDAGRLTIIFWLDGVQFVVCCPAVSVSFSNLDCGAANLGK
jgi:hypothetical protein